MNATPCEESPNQSVFSQYCAYQLSCRGAACARVLSARRLPLRVLLLSPLRSVSMVGNHFLQMPCAYVPSSQAFHLLAVAKRRGYLTWKGEKKLLLGRRSDVGVTECEHANSNDGVGRAHKRGVTKVHRSHPKYCSVWLRYVSSSRSIQYLNHTKEGIWAQSTCIASMA
jgi:hypothetical protein